MVDATITDGTTTKTFELFTDIDHSLQAQNVFTRAIQNNIGQIVVNRAMFFEAYKFTAVFRTTGVSPNTAFEKYLDFVDFTRTSHATYGYQRKLKYYIPGSTSAHNFLNGVVTNVAINSKYGYDEQRVVFGFDFILDNISTQVP